MKKGTPITGRIYFAVPGPYGIGPEFDTEAEAEAAALAEVEAFVYNPGTDRETVTITAAVIEERIDYRRETGGGQDTILRRRTIRLTEEERVDLRDRAVAAFDGYRADAKGVTREPAVG
jgi:hypothetical protein